MAKICAGHEQNDRENRHVIQTEADFLEALEKELSYHPDKKQIVAEYEVHIAELTADLQADLGLEGDYMDEVINRLGSPQFIAETWKAELAVTPNRAQWIFVCSNLLFFISGIMLTMTYHLYQWKWVDGLWNRLTSIPAAIIAVYFGFWSLLGYEMGKEFGSGGKKVLNRTFLFCLIPNLLLMYLVLFKIIPKDWFQPLLNSQFIIVCVVSTFFLYPVSLIGYQWGKKSSL